MDGLLHCRWTTERARSRVLSMYMLAFYCCSCKWNTKERSSQSSSYFRLLFPFCLSSWSSLLPLSSTSSSIESFKATHISCKSPSVKNEFYVANGNVACCYPFQHHHSKKPTIHKLIHTHTHTHETIDGRNDWDDRRESKVEKNRFLRNAFNICRYAICGQFYILLAKPPFISETEIEWKPQKLHNLIYIYIYILCASLLRVSPPSPVSETKKTVCLPFASFCVYVRFGLMKSRRKPKRTHQK